MCPATNSLVRVVIADDHPIVRAGLNTLLSASPSIEIVAEVSDGVQLVRLLDRMPVDVVILDLSMPGRDGLALLRQLRSRAPNVRIVIVSSFEPAIYADRCLQLGAYAFLDKRTSPEKIVSTVLAAAVSPPRSAPPPASETDEAPHRRLSDRQYEVFALLVQGVSVTEIAERLHLSVKTVSTHKVAVQQRLGAKSVVDLVKYAAAHGLIETSTVTAPQPDAGE
ncbi:MAG: response regulator transcription factor [Casimicrobiaceae bacterium]|nr:response regulator transcription factor [Casimicrobiaceae bacterium]